MTSSSNVLSHLEIVITRPRAQGEKWQSQLQALGAQAYLLPVLEIRSLKTQASDISDKSSSDNHLTQKSSDCSTSEILEKLNALKSIVLGLDEFQKIIFVSQNAVSEAAIWIDDYWPQHPIGIEYFAVGSATAKLAIQHDFQITAPHEAMNSEDLLALDNLANVKDQKILIFRGVGGRNYLSEELTKRGALVTYGELYTRELPQNAFTQILELKLGNAGRKTVLSAHSGESVVNLNRVLDCLESENSKPRFDFKKLPLLIPGERVAKIAKNLGFQELIIAKNATDDEMIQTLFDWQSR